MSKSKEEQKGRIMPREDFRLTKFKLTKDGVTITHHVNGITPADITAVCEAKPHPDFVEAVDKLKLYFATRLGLLEGWDFAREHLKKNPNYLQKAIEGHKRAIDRMNVGGFQFQGSGDTFGVSFTGSIGVPIKGSTGLTVPKITFSDDALGYEDEVCELCEEITDEVYNYLILRKKAQTDVEDQAEGFDNDGGFEDPDQSVMDFSKPEDDEDSGMVPESNEEEE